MKVLYTGSFNPFHNGHQYVYDLACLMFGKENVWIGIGQNTDKKTVDLEHLKFSVIPITRNVIAYDALTAEVVLKNNFNLLIRGIRPGFSLDQENQLLYWNKRLSGVDTVFIPTPPEVNQISSGAIRELFKHHCSVSEYMNKDVLNRWSNTQQKTKVYFGKCCSGKSTYLRQQAATPLIFDFDKNWIKCSKSVKEYLDNMLPKVKEAFYNKDPAFYKLTNEIASNMNWGNLFWGQIPGTIYDIPALGNYWNSISDYYKGNLYLIKCSTSEENRQYFASCRNVNPKLIECNNVFYNDPPYWDEEIIIERYDLI